MKISELLIKENNNLDLIRIFLSCAVILGHSHTLNGSSGYWIDPIRHYFEFTNSGPLAVKTFLFISGLVVTNSLLQKKSAIYFLISRFFRIIPALFFVLLITASIIGPLVTNDQNYWSSFGAFKYLSRNLVFYTYHSLPGVFSENLYPNVVNGSLWSLRYEVGAYFFLFLSYLFLGIKNKYLLLFPIFLIVIDSFLPQRIVLSFIENNSDKYLLPLFFSYGVILALLSDKIQVDFYFILITLLSYIFFFQSSFKEIFFALLVCNIFLYLSKVKWFLSLKPSYDISYGIYLWGFIVQQAVYHYLGHLNIGVHFLISISFSIFLALITYKFIERPFMLVGKKVFNFLNKLI